MSDVITTTAPLYERLLGEVQLEMDVESYILGTQGAEPGAGEVSGTVTLAVRGRLYDHSESVYERLSSRFATLGHVPLLRKDGGYDVVMAVAGALPASNHRPQLAAALLLATIISVIWTGASQYAYDGTFNWLDGLPFATALMLILIAHESGHYIVSRHFGTPTSFPYFIPLPFVSIFGTLGAVMQMQAPPANRRQLLAIGSAGPLAGLVFAVPLLLLGLSMSTVQSIPAGEMYLQEGNSLLYMGFKLVVFGRILPAGHEDVLLHPVAFAAWTGLLVTALNLMPAGQLDGGHIIYALFGRHSRLVTWGVIAVLLLLATAWQGWLLWAAMIYFLGRSSAVPLNDISPLDATSRRLGFLMIAITVLVFVPIPLLVR